MRVLIQIVKEARVEIDNKVVGQIKKGLLLFVGFSSEEDDESNLEKMIDKILTLRIFPDENGKTNLSIRDVDGDILSVSQFTLYADASGGRRPSFTKAMRPEFARELYLKFNSLLEKSFEKKIETGVFGADMKVHLINDGPFTIMLDSKDLFE